MDFKAGYLRSSIGRKTLVAATGLVYFGFVVVHMLGNLQIFLGQEKINAYGQSLRDIAPLLWVARIILIVSFIIHVFYAIKLSIENKQARPIPYVKKNTVQASLASRTMALTGLFNFFLYRISPSSLHSRRHQSGSFCDDGCKRETRHLYDGSPRFSKSDRLRFLHLCDVPARVPHQPRSAERISDVRSKRSFLKRQDQGGSDLFRFDYFYRKHFYPAFDSAGIRPPVILWRNFYEFRF